MTKVVGRFTFNAGKTVEVSVLCVSTSRYPLQKCGPDGIRQPHATYHLLAEISE